MKFTIFAVAAFAGLSHANHSGQQSNATQNSQQAETDSSKYSPNYLKGLDPSFFKNIGCLVNCGVEAAEASYCKKENLLNCGCNNVDKIHQIASKCAVQNCKINDAYSKGKPIADFAKKFCAKHSGHSGGGYSGGGSSGGGYSGGGSSGDDSSDGDASGGGASYQGGSSGGGSRYPGGPQ
ncbi:hypothetical protein XA68_12012 [Ophiocordyceps unilateralis]|uniref:Extracellular membrane protein CFEM domain-containing protein n=1 Tax=Ophiocordyceps unilateralis TaxID=268505 RepID=A0A2A9PE67_OPHUN|nr:hypothetical protein XA68_12012 [Ophiocordyceps unilateralis]